MQNGAKTIQHLLFVLFKHRDWNQNGNEVPNFRGKLVRQSNVDTYINLETRTSVP